MYWLFQSLAVHRYRGQAGGEEVWRLPSGSREWRVSRRVKVVVTRMHRRFFLAPFTTRSCLHRNLYLCFGRWVVRIAVERKGV